MKNSMKYSLIIFSVFLLSGLMLLVDYVVRNKSTMNPAYYNGGSRNLPSPSDPILDSIVCGKTDSLYCKIDDDCICAGDGTQYPGCFTGNKAYYEKCEDKSMSCTDHCQGWGQPPVKCINNKCSNSYNGTGSGI